MINDFRQRNLNITNPRSWFKNRRNLLIAGAVVMAVVILGFLFINYRQGKVSGVEQGPTVKINQTYTVTARTKERKATDGNLELTVTNAQIGSSILVQGKVARPIKGKAFLIINMEIENPYKVALYAFPVDLFRFVRSDGQKFAPSVHQGTVEIRPQATKKSNIAFVVAPSDKKFTIEVGEIGKDKETLEITFR
ncbi:MAG: hypothetical protein A2126_03715 [Candidatus Woykebacteria bacterium GWB1_45_5]|uniref:DUF4352 domain-containing protein n=2 Tax=Candidatus Woykeibacteriota TaxID=1817899 RepID=A0A1G1W083_9BACT|nr:MAG: hypothetical protein A2113_03025 [Candidatus Woykebacteria bacterium GWA1_44_8]OGY23364.1 MAG: hypothetical protein A2126_03715 [Candidatus Woykebacteria bacterium GWB1_45_5]